MNINHTAGPLMSYETKTQRGITVNKELFWCSCYSQNHILMSQFPFYHQHVAYSKQVWAGIFNMIRPPAFVQTFCRRLSLTSFGAFHQNSSRVSLDSLTAVLGCCSLPPPAPPWGWHDDTVFLPSSSGLWLCTTGAESWPPGVSLKYIGGDQFGHVNAVMVKSLEPQEVSDVSVQMRSPTAPGMYQGQWRMCTSTGLFYGGRNQLLAEFIQSVYVTLIDLIDGSTIKWMLPGLTWEKKRHFKVTWCIMSITESIGEFLFINLLTTNVKNAFN